MRAALRRHFAQGAEGKATFATAVDLTGNVSTTDDPYASVYWLPLYEALERHDSAYRRTLRALQPAPREGEGEGEPLAYLCAQLFGPSAEEVLQRIRRAPLDGGFAAELIDAEGRVVANGGDAALSGLVAWCAWYAVHALGVRS